MAAAIAEDRISGLADEILLEILSLLPDTRLAFQTSVLSHRWRHLPSHCPVIRLPFLHHCDETTKRYIRTVDGCLLALRAPTLHCLQIEIPNYLNAQTLHYLQIDISNYPNVDAAADRWICFAGQRSVRELHLSVFSSSVSYPGTCTTGRPYVPCFFAPAKSIPSSVFSSSVSLSLTSLHVNNCSFKAVPNSFQGFSLLRELSMSDSGVKDQDFAQLLWYCPVLESLQLINLYNCAVLRLDPARVPKLKHLRIVNFSIGKGNVMVVETPGLRSLSVEAYFGNIILKDCPLLSDVEIYGRLLDCSLLSSVSMVDRISVDEWFFEAEFVRSHFSNNSVAVFENLKRLCCDVNCVTDSMLGAFPSILEECPLLVELRVKIKGHKEVFQFDQQNKHGIEYCCSHQSWLKTTSEFTSTKLNSHDDLEQDGCGSSEHFKGIWKSSHQLKYAVVQGFLGSKNEARLLQFLLRHVTTLEKLVVIGFDFQFCDQTMVHELLSHFCQGFPHVQIIQQFQKL